jgi:hypothetical protein
MPNRYSDSDRNAGRTSQPFTKPQKPTKKYELMSADGREVVATTKMNWRGVAGGLPTDNARDLRDRARANERLGHTASAEAAKKRAASVEGHQKMTAAAKRQLQMEAQERQRAVAQKERERAAAERRARISPGIAAERAKKR